MNPILIKIGPIEIRWYAILILIGVSLAYLLINGESKRLNIKKDFMFNMFFWGIICGFIGARVYYVIFNWDYYCQNLIEVLEIWKGGLAIHGGIIGGLLAILIHTKKYNARTIRYLDIIVPGLAIGQSVGRWGNFFNSEAHGVATTFEHLKTLHIPDFIINGMKIDNVYYTPTFLYESLACFVLCLFIIITRRGRYRKVGYPTAIYLIGYGIIRFFIEISRTDALMIAGFKMAQIASIIMIVVGIILLIKNSRKSRFEDLYNNENNIDQLKY